MESLLSYTGKQPDANQLFYRELLEGLPVAVYACDANGIITFCNPAAVVLWGRKPELGKEQWCGSWKIYNPDGTDLPLDKCPMSIALKEKRPVYGHEIVIERGDGSRRHVLPHPRPFLNTDGTLAGGLNMLVDITDIRQAEHSLRESEMLFRSIADHASVLIWIADSEGAFIFCNKGWIDYTGKPMDIEYGSGWMDTIYPEDRKSLLSIFANTITDTSFYIEFRLKRHDGKFLWFSCRVSPRFNATGQFVGYIGSCSDIDGAKKLTEQLELEVAKSTKELRDANTALENSNRELAQFAYIASHDLQEPLRKIKFFVTRLQELNEGKLDDASLSYIHKTVSAAQRMENLIRDVLNFSRLMDTESEFEPVDLNEILKTILADFDLQISEKKAIIHAMPLPVIEAIPLQMMQLFRNIVSNSLKFSKDTETPVIEISVRTLNSTEIPPQLVGNPKQAYEIIFKDNGIGFEQEYAEKAFVIFQRLTAKVKGSGIGLALCRKIALLHRGDIFAVSQPDIGTSIHVILPAPQHV